MVFYKNVFSQMPLLEANEALLFLGGIGFSGIPLREWLRRDFSRILYILCFLLKFVRYFIYLVIKTT